MAETVKDIESGARITAHVGSLQFDRRNALRLRYRLLPGQSSWKAERFLDLDLGRLEWGTHRLEVQARLGAGPWSSSAVKSFTVLRPLWLSWPIALGCFAAGGVAAAEGYRRRKRRLQKANIQLPELSALRLALFLPDLAKIEGSTLDERFKIRAKLASGGFGTVFYGSDLKQEGKPCAVKIFRRELRDKSWMSKRFQQEVSALRQTNHRNVVGIYGSGTTPTGAFYLAMELIHGKTLRTLLDEGKLHRSHTSSYLRQTASALTEIHARGICHRDVKPENLMIRNAAAPGEELVLIDFSIAIVQDPDETMHGLSRAAGTLYYMAPEQAIGYADASSDIYSLAKTLIEMLTGERLSSLLPDASMDLSVRVRELLAQLPLGLSVGAIDLIAAALEFDPAKRPKVASEFADRICHDLERGAENRERS
jgi:tRNA A-37 threonylcarbamoyl transferase component Bud32